MALICNGKTFSQLRNDGVEMEDKLRVWDKYIYTAIYKIDNKQGHTV